MSLKARDLKLLAVALLAGILFFSSLHRLWPLADANLMVPAPVRERRAREFLQGQGFDLRGHAAASKITVEESALDYVERTFGRAHAQTMIRQGYPLIAYDVTFKRAGSVQTYGIGMHPGGSVLNWRKSLQEDDPGRRIGSEAARKLARRELERGLGTDPAMWREMGVSTRELPRRVDYVFNFERTLSETPELKERAGVRVAGGMVAGASRWIVVPAAAGRAAHRREAPRQALLYVGQVLFAVAVVAAFAVFLTRLRDGSVRLGQAALWSAVVFGCSLGSYLLQGARLFAAWDPLWSRWVSALQYVVSFSENNLWTFGVLLAVTAAGDSLDQQTGGGRGKSLWLLSRGRITDARVGAASARGFLVGLICGGVMAAALMLLENIAGARTSLQPRGFFFYALNSSAPALSTLLFFLNIALLEELGYRFFAGSWLLLVTKQKWLAIFVPALVYGLTHTTLTFLPPAEPFWGRALVMTLVGCIWGWAFFRYDALTVVLSHLTCDLFIFNWPRLASGNPALAAVAILTIAVPLIPAIACAALRLLHGRVGTDAVPTAPAPD